MIKILYPDFIFSSVREIDADFFRKNNIKNVILDIDNTLVPYTVERPTQLATAFFERLKSEGINVCLVSNNNKKRVNLFNDGTGFYAVARSCKPLRFAIHRAMRHLNAKPEETAIIGDQVFTDVYGGNRSKITTVLVDPIEMKESAFFKFKRKWEKRVLDRMEKDKSKEGKSNV